MAKKPDIIKRQQRVLLARATGESVVDIARREGVRRETIHADLNAIRDGALDAPDTMLLIRTEAAQILADAKESNDHNLALRALTRLESAVATTIKAVEQRELDERVKRLEKGE